MWPFCACVVQNMLYYTYLCRNVRNSRVIYRKSGSWNMMVTSGFRPEVEIWQFRARAVKIRYKTLIYGGIAKIPLSYMKSGSRNTMVTSDFKPEVEIWPFCACEYKIRHIAYSAIFSFFWGSSSRLQPRHPHLWRNRRNSPILLEIGVEKHDGDVRF